METRFTVRFLRALRLAAMCALCLMSARADALVVASHDWEDSGSLQGWTNPLGESWVHLSNPNAGGNPGGYLQVAMDSVVFNEYETLINVDANGLFTGNWDTDMSIQFDFWAENSTPEEIRIEWGSTAGSGTAWGNTVFAAGDSMGLGTWTTLTTANFMDYMNWDFQGTGNQSDFLSDLESIDWIGVYIFRGSSDADTYGLDNFQLMVPEPAESLLLFTALVTTGLGWRKRRKRGEGLELRVL